MSQFILLYILAGLLIVAFGVLLILGIIQKHKVKIIFSVFFFIGAGLSAGYATHLLMKKVITLPGFKSSGTELYAENFGDTSNYCISVINKKEGIFPARNTWLEFTSCPGEMERIMNRKNYEHQVIRSDDSGYLNRFPEAPHWWHPSTLGDSVHLLQDGLLSPTYRQVVIFSLDTTRGYSAQLFR